MLGLVAPHDHGEERRLLLPTADTATRNIPPIYDGLRPEDRAAYWDGVLRREDRRGAVLVAERAGEVVGFAAAGPSPDPEGAGELFAIDLDPAHWGTGAGRALLEAAQAELDRLGFDESVLWVLPGNARARRFYEAAGWAADGTERTIEVEGMTLPEVRYRRRLPAPG